MAEVVYMLCALTSAACAVMLFRAFLGHRMPLLFWSALCFVALTVNNALLFVDLVVIPDVDIMVWRNLAALIGMALLVYGLVWETA